LFIVFYGMGKDMVNNSTPALAIAAAIFLVFGCLGLSVRTLEPSANVTQEQILSSREYWKSAAPLSIENYSISEDGKALLSIRNIGNAEVTVTSVMLGPSTYILMGQIGQNKTKQLKWKTAGSKEGRNYSYPLKITYRTEQGEHGAENGTLAGVFGPDSMDEYLPDMNRSKNLP
jgi:hypothetical protein